MGIWNSLKGQIGRDTGKVVSNLVWGDKHASVYRRAENRKQETLKLKQEALEHQKQQDERTYVNNIISKTEDKIMEINSIEMPDDKKELIDLLNKLALLLKSNPFKKENEENNNNKITNAYSKAILTKYEQTLLTFESLYNEDTRIGYYRKQFKKFKFQRIKVKIWSILWN